MSDILIKGMEMPTDCAMMLKIFPDGRVGVPVHLNWCGTMVVNDAEAIPVPPHGRLIESVELYGKAEEIKTKALSTYDKPQSWQFGVFWAIEQIEAALTNAPTIIPAEGGE